MNLPRPLYCAALLRRFDARLPQNINIHIANADLRAFAQGIIIQVAYNRAPHTGPAGVGSYGVAVDDAPVRGTDIELRAIGNDVGVDGDAAESSRDAC